MQTSTKIKIGLFSATLLIAIGTAVYQVNTWSNSYNKMEQKQIQNFDTLWSEIWDTKTKTFTSKLDQNVVQKLDKLAGTPSQQKQLNLAKASVSLVMINNQESTLTQFIAATNTYYQLEKNDNDYPEQQKINTSTINEIETLITSINKNIDILSITNNNIDFNKNIESDIKLEAITTNLKWSDLKTFNSHIAKINSLIQTQVQENKDRYQQEEIIQLKDKLDEFVTLAKQYESNIKTQYITIKDLNLILSKLSNIDVSKRQDWFSDLKTYDKTPESTIYSTSFTNKFFTDNNDLQKYQSELSQIVISINFTRTTSEVSQKTDEKNEQSFKYSLNTSVSQEENDLINLNSLKNISIEITHTQMVKFYVNKTTTSSSGNGSNTNPSTQSSTIPIPIPIRGQD